MRSSQPSVGFRLSRQQERLWRTSAHDQALVRGRVRVDGPINPMRLRERLHKLVARHEILRTNIDILPGTTQPIQIIAESRIDIDIHDFIAVARKDRNRVLANVEKELRFQRLDGSALHMEIIRFSDALHYLVVSVSPLCCDAFGLQNIVRELARSYDESRDAMAEESEPLQYADYSAWQEELQSTDDDAGIRYWRVRADTHLSAARLPLENATRNESSFKQKSITLRLPRRIVKAVSKLVERASASPQAVLLGAWVALLHRHSDARDISLHYSSEGRSGPIAQAIGAYSLDLPLTVHVEPHEEFEQFLSRLQAVLDEDREWLDYAPVAGAGASVGQLGFEYSNAMAPLRAGSVSMSLEAATTPSPPYRLRLKCRAEKNNFEVALYYNAAQFTIAAIERLIEQWTTLLDDVSRTPETTIGRSKLMSSAEQERSIRDLRASAAQTPLQGEGLHTLAERQAKVAPEAPALIYGNESWSYGELDRRAAALAEQLSALQIRAEDRVGLAIRNPLWMVTAIFAVLKAGGAYVPLDPDHPAERLSFVLEDAGVALLLTDAATVQIGSSSSCPRMILDRDVVANLDTGVRTSPSEGRLVGVNAQQLAYVIYTSGSTGQPKGVAVSHGAAVHSTLARHLRYREPVRGFLLASSFTFDSSIAGLFWTLGQGGRLCLPTTAELREPEALARLIERHELSHLLCLPSLYAILREHEHSRLRSLRTVIVAGERCPPRLALTHREGAPHACLYNEYGPTEGTVWSTVGEVSTESSLSFVSIGSPIAGVHVALLDERRELISQGLGGELHIGGAGLARGYLGRPDLTAERFVPNPFGRAGERLYRTGDLARYRADGNIEFLGRIDHQVKIRGFRIELGEIEAALTRLPQLREAVVIASEDGHGDKRLVAYVVAAEGAALEIAELRGALARELPDYMIPAAFVALDALPLTPNGKIDRRALPAPDLDAQIAHRYVAPRNATEEALCRIFADVLGIDRVGVDDDFFQLGGHSLLAMTLVETLRGHGLRTDVRTLFANPTPGRFALAMGDGGDVVVPPNLIPPGCGAITPDMLTLATLSQAEIDRIVAQAPGGASNIQDIYPLAPLQEGILFHHLIAQRGDPYLDARPARLRHRRADRRFSRRFAGGRRPAGHIAHGHRLGGLGRAHASGVARCDADRRGGFARRRRRRRRRAIAPTLRSARLSPRPTAGSDDARLPRARR